ncbi:MAG: hypothetical protein WA941_10980 [Nitrososphaeraceae archaeon]
MKTKETPLVKMDYHYCYHYHSDTLRHTKPEYCQTRYEFEDWNRDYDGYKISCGYQHRYYEDYLQLAVLPLETTSAYMTQQSRPLHRWIDRSRGKGRTRIENTITLFALEEHSSGHEEEVSKTVNIIS